MAPESRRADSLIEALFARGYEFDFFEAVRLLSGARGRRGDVGTASRPGDEPVRFKVHSSLAFPASAIHEIQSPARPGEPPEMAVAFMGLTGVQGVLPHWYTEYLLARATAKDPALGAFFDLFNHRLISLFYRAWKKNRPAVLYEAAALRGAAPDPFTHRLFDFTGMGTARLRERLAFPDERLLSYAGLIAQRPHSAAALQGILRDFLGVAIELRQLTGKWHRLADTDRTVLDENPSDRLGEGAFVGGEIWDQQAGCRLTIGPLTLEQYLDFLPAGSAMARLRDLAVFFAGPVLCFDVRLILRREEVPSCRLSEEGPSAARLGLLGWLKTSAFEDHAAGATFEWTN